MTVGDTLITCRVTEVVHVAVCMLWWHHRLTCFFTVRLAGNDFVSSFLFAQSTVRMCCICLGRLCYWCWQKFALRVLLCTMQQKWHVLWYVPQVLDFMFTDSDC
jgi:hypothetical protein